jgi:hypothetical protein
MSKPELQPKPQPEQSPQPEQESQATFYDQMVQDLHVLMDHPVPNPEREAWLEEQKAKDKTSQSREKSILSTHSEYILSHEILLKCALLDLKDLEGVAYMFSPTYSLEVTVGEYDPHCVWEANHDSSVHPKVHFKIFLNNLNHPFTQEELLHAAQEILFETDHINTFSIQKTSEQLVHSSFILDMAMSVAAAEEGTWAQWHQKAQDLWITHKNHFTFTYAWKSTLLGKSINKRFQYQSVSTEDVGKWWKNLSGYFEQMFTDFTSPEDHQMAEIFEFGCLAYGVLHRDLTFALIDLPIDSLATNEEAGRIVVDWAKKVMALYQGTEHEAELLSHHSDVRSIPDEYFTYQKPAEILEELQDWATKPTWPLTNSIKTYTLKRIARENWNVAVADILQAYERRKNPEGLADLLRILHEHDLSLPLFNHIIAIASQQYLNQFQRQNMFSGALLRSRPSMRVNMDDLPEEDHWA